MAQTPVSGNMINNNLITKIGEVAGATNPLNNQTLGYTNEVRVWNVARTQAELRSTMSGPLPNATTQPGLLAYYSFNNLYNKQGNPAFNGTLQGAAVINQTNPLCTPSTDSCEILPPPPVTIGFDLPDTICANTPITITNTSANATTSYWNFCSGSLNATPAGTNIPSALLSQPAFLSICQEGMNYYVFVVNHTGSLVRMNYGNNLLNTPVNTDLGSFGGIIPFQSEGIDIEKDGNNWIGYLIGGQNANSRLVKLFFGNSLANIPVVTNLNNIGNLAFPKDFTLFKDAGTWYGFTVNGDNNSIVRYNFGVSLNNIPVATSFTNVGSLNYPVGIFLIKNTNDFHIFVTNRNSHSISRIDFGNSLANTPTGVNLPIAGSNFNWPRDITVIKDCEKVFGFVVNEGSNSIVRLDFNNNDLLATPTATNLGNIGNFSFPCSLSEIFRTGNSANIFVPNITSNSISRITFNNCSNASIPSYIGNTPPAFQYDQPGTYNVSLFVDEGLPTQAVICKQIVVKDCGNMISGVINDYTEVLAFDPCKNTLTVANATAYKAGDTVLVIQMKGAVIDSTNTASFGTITDYKSAGNYEFNYVKSKTGNSIELTNALTRTYEIPDGVVQLVRVPYYQNAIITSSITCLPWDGSKGGIVAFNVQDALRFNEGIDVVGKGFRGGSDPVSNPSTMNCYENQFYYPPNPDLASGKGEGIALISAQKSFGKGAIGNGGGGGNSHNSGGGGGSNGNVGGFGGYSFEFAPCDATVPFDNRGIGGKALLYNNTANKIFMGGGGGAGHTNNPEAFQALGGNGGGIVIVSANVIASDGIIRAFGRDGIACPGLGPTGCHEGMGGGGAGGTILLNVNTYLEPFVVNTKGGQGANMIVAGAGRLGAGGGASGGVTWYKSAAIPPLMSIPSAGGVNGTNTEYTNDPWGATPGLMGLQLFDLQLPVDVIPFKPNIDSVRIKDSLTSCRSFDFKGLGYTNTHPIASWQWYFGDGGTDVVQNTLHTYTNAGTYTVKLIVTDINGCKDSISKEVTAISLALDFNYQVNPCTPLEIQFTGIGSANQNPYWSFGDNTTLAGSLNPVHTYLSQNNYTVQYSANNGVCTDTIKKTISLFITPADIVLTPDTTICYGTTKQLRAKQALSFCWTPVTYLDNPAVSNPITSATGPITYYYTAQVAGNNLIVNGDFSQGNTGIISDYNFANPNTTEGQYFVGTNPQAWNPNLTACADHTTGNGNMMLVNGSATDNAKVWSQTIAVLPNINYAFSTWIQDVAGQNPATLQFSINGINMGAALQAGSPCVWQQFYTTWNSGNNTSAVISIVNKNLILSGNDFALDDISFAPVFIQRDSVKITVDTAFVKTNNDDAVCEGKSLQLNTTGGVSYTWTQAATLSDAAIADPVATPVVSTEYIVTGTNANGCIAKDTVNITVNPKPAITKSADQEICKNASVQIFATGGGTYAWTPAATLDDPALSNPTASPVTNTRYYVTVTGTNTCTNIDSVDIGIRPDPVFTVGAGGSICDKDSIQLTASGGDIYSWQPIASLSNAGIANPRAAPSGSTNYSVTITETTCDVSTVLQTNVTVNPLPLVKATKSNDLDCSNDRSHLKATGAASYMWTPALSLDNSNIPNPVATPVVNTKYIVKGTDGLGCVNYDSVIVEFLAVNASGYFMPNAFTPNRDGLNDCYGIRYWGVIRELEFSIYNRWGERIFFTKDPSACWDGNYKGVMQGIGVYVYMIKAKTLCGDTFKKGTFTLAK
jgi:gliding motility-associated-like protein